MRGSTWSLRKRLLLLLLVPLLAVGALLLLDAYRSARIAADLAHDQLIAASALAIADRVAATDGSLDIDLPYVALEMLATAADDRVFYRITDHNGRFVTGYPDLQHPEAGTHKQTDNPFFYDAKFRGEEVRVVLLTQAVTAPGVAGRFSVQVAQTRGERNLLTRDLAFSTGVRLLLMIVLVGLITWFATRFGLRPLARLRAEIRERTPQDLRPLDVEVPREVRDLVSAIDTLMMRLEKSLLSMEQFITDAAHQLRAPLAALQTQVETALREREPASLRSRVEHLQTVTWRTSRLATQLLSDARSTADVRTQPKSRVDLADLAADVARSQVPAALLKNIDLGFESDDMKDPIYGDDVLLKEALTNLVDNALRYCPENASVTVRVRSAGDDEHVILEVEDDGPGIPPGSRQRVLERFYRVPGSRAEGSGLGLAIVKAVVDGHDGTISFRDAAAGGLLVRITLPRGRG